jgi:FlaA1/EpsC-like NDP-sugar epimerase
MSHLSAMDVEAIIERSSVPIFSRDGSRLIEGRRVLVTGAGGSIGGELVRQLSRLGPDALWMLDHDESSMHAVQLDLFGDGQLSHERTVLADIRDYRRMEKLMGELQPEIVFHAAAHKHLAILERYPSEAVKTNVWGTEATLLAAVESGAERFILVSTDKAANPTSVLGATKRMAELLTQRAGLGAMKTASVRFGNVLGSRGSFLYTLHHQLRRGMPITVTDPDVERYFMTIPEAASLVVEAAGLANSGEIYVLDMGDPVRIVDLVERYASVRGFPRPQIQFTGLLRGEKLSEQLVDRSEVMNRTRHKKIWQVPPVHHNFDMIEELDALAEAAAGGDEDLVMQHLSDIGFMLEGHCPAFGRESIPA